MRKALGSIICLDSNVYAYAASERGDTSQRRLTAEAQSLIGFVKLGMFRLLHSGLVDREIDDFRNELARKRIERVVPQSRNVYRCVSEFLDLLDPAIALANRLKLDGVDALHAMIASAYGATYLVSSENKNFISKLRAFRQQEPKAYRRELGELRAVHSLEWHAEIIGHG